MMYKCENLTLAGVVSISTIPAIRAFLNDRQRSVDAKMKKAIKQGLRAGDHPEADALIEECQLILALQKEMSTITMMEGVHKWTLNFSNNINRSFYHLKS